MLLVDRIYDIKKFKSGIGVTQYGKERLSKILEEIWPYTQWYKLSTIQDNILKKYPRWNINRKDIQALFWSLEFDGFVELRKSNGECWYKAKMEDEMLQESTISDVVTTVSDINPDTCITLENGITSSLAELIRKKLIDSNVQNSSSLFRQKDILEHCQKNINGICGYVLYTLPNLTQKQSQVLQQMQIPAPGKLVEVQKEVPVKENDYWLNALLTIYNEQSLNFDTIRDVLRTSFGITDNVGRNYILINMTVAKLHECISNGLEIETIGQLRQLITSILSDVSHMLDDISSVRQPAIEVVSTPVEIEQPVRHTIKRLSRSRLRSGTADLIELLFEMCGSGARVTNNDLSIKFNYSNSHTSSHTKWLYERGLVNRNAYEYTNNRNLPIYQFVFDKPLPASLDLTKLNKEDQAIYSVLKSKQRITARDIVHTTKIDHKVCMCTLKYFQKYGIVSTSRGMGTTVFYSLVK